MKTLSRSLIAKELAKRATRKNFELDPNFKAQTNFVLDKSRYIAARCSRRAGKTNGLALKFFLTLEQHPKSQCLYLALTRESAQSIMWPILQEFNDTYNLGCKFKPSRLEMKHPNGAKLRLIGADAKNFIKRLRGIKSPGIGVDEAQDFGPHLKSLIDDVLTPMLADYTDGWLAITGTPGPVPHGYFYEVTSKNMHGFSLHSWTLFENPHMPKPQDFLADLKKRRGWEDTNPTLLREWLNQWVSDPDSLWIKFKPNVSNYTDLPIINAPWNYILGIDIGFKDADAIAVIAWHDSCDTTFLVEEWVKPKQDLTDLVEAIKSFQEKYKAAKMIIDEGGLGKKLAEELRRRHSIPVVGADKQRKQETVGFLNDALAIGKFKVQANSRFVQDSYLVQVDWEKSRPDKIAIKRYPHSDIIDSVLYAFKESPAFAWQQPAARTKFGTQQYWDEEAKRLEEAAEAYYSDQETKVNPEDYL